MHGEPPFRLIEITTRHCIIHDYFNKREEKAGAHIQANFIKEQGTTPTPHRHTRRPAEYFSLKK